jgi:hypothetical protein
MILLKHEEVLSFCLKKITEDHPRDDYKKFIELIIIELGETPPSGVKIVNPANITKLGGWLNVFIVSRYFYYGLN